MPERQDHEARFNRLYERHLDAVRAYAWRRAPGLADEIVAETFLVAWRRLPDVPDDALPWLIGVARNVRANLHRSDRRQDALVQRLGPEPTAGADPLASVDEREALRGALAGLSETDRESCSSPRGTTSTAARWRRRSGARAPKSPCGSLLQRRVAALHRQHDRRGGARRRHDGRPVPPRQLLMRQSPAMKKRQVPSGSMPARQPR